jgi:hypothetical protein
MWSWIGRILRAIVGGIMDSLLSHDRKIQQKGKDDVTTTMFDDYISESSGFRVRDKDGDAP